MKPRNDFDRNDFDRNLDDMAAACRGAPCKRSFLTQYFEKLFVSADSTLGIAIMEEILKRSEPASSCTKSAPEKSAPEKSMVRPEPRHSFDSEDFRKSLRRSRLTTPDDGYWG